MHNISHVFHTPFTDCSEIEHGRLSLNFISSFLSLSKLNTLNTYKLNSVALVLEQTIPTEWPPPVGGVSAKFADRGVSRGQRNRSPWPLISVFWTGAATFLFK